MKRLSVIFLLISLYASTGAYAEDEFPFEEYTLAIYSGEHTSIFNMTSYYFITSDMRNVRMECSTAVFSTNPYLRITVNKVIGTYLRHETGVSRLGGSFKTRTGSLPECIATVEEVAEHLMKHRGFVHFEVFGQRRDSEHDIVFSPL